VELECYLKKYSNKYKVRRNSDGHYEIICNGGTIFVHSLQKGILGYTYYDSGKNTIRSKNYAIKRIKNSGLWWEFRILCETEFIVHIKETELDQWGDILKLYKKRKYTSEYRKVLVERLKVARGFKQI